MEERTLSADVSVRLRYLQHVPAENDGRLPLVLFLHGAGERGDDLNHVAVHGPPKQVAAGRNLPFVLIAPQCPADSWWTFHLRELDVLLDEAIDSHAIDPNRVYITGISMGGQGTWELATLRPERFAAAAPICGWGSPWLAARLKQLPIWAFHSKRDPTVPIEGSRMMVKAVNAAGGNSQLTEYRSIKHDAWTRTYDNSALYDWLLAQTRDGHLT